MAGKKNFYNKQDTNKKLAGESNAVPQNTGTKKEHPASVEPTAPENPKPEPQIKKAAGKKGQKYLRLDVTDYQDYISLMAQHMTNTKGKYVSMTQYILSLIEADKQSNLTLYEKLEQIENMKRELI